MIKKTVILIPVLLMTQFATGYSQEPNKTIPDVNVSTLNGTSINSSEIENDGKPMILFFWTTWCHHSKEALTTIQDDYYEDWQEEYGLKLVGISIDDARNAVKVGPFASGLGWEYEIYLDENADLKRAMGVNNAPHVFIVDGDRNIVWQQEVFNSGDEEVLDEQLSNLVGKKK